MSKKEIVCAVVVTYNRKDLLIQCLDALLRQIYPLDAIYIIDNVSTDGTPQFLKDKGYIKEVLNPSDRPLENENIVNMLSPKNEDKEVKVLYIRMHKNTGGAGGFYEGLRKGYEKGYGWLWLIEDDVAPDAECLYNLMCAGGYAKVPVPIKLNRDGYKVEDTSAIHYDLDAFWIAGGQCKKSVFEKFKNKDELPDTLKIEDFTFEGPLLHRDIIKKAGLPVKEFFIWADDTEYAIRLRKMGYELIILKNSVMRRFLKIEIYKGKRITSKHYYYWRNLFWIYRKHGNNIMVRLLRPICFLLGLCIKRLSEGNFNKIFLVFKAFIDSYSKLPNKYN